MQSATERRVVEVDLKSDRLLERRLSFYEPTTFVATGKCSSSPPGTCIIESVTTHRGNVCLTGAIGFDRASGKDCGVPRLSGGLVKHLAKNLNWQLFICHGRLEIR